MEQGCCCINEFDKTGNQHQVLLEAMVSQLGGGGGAGTGGLGLLLFLTRWAVSIRHC